MIRKKRNAFLLFEVTLTIAILSLGLVFVVRAINMSMRAAQQSFNYNKAIGLLSKKVFEIELESELGGVEKSSDEGKFSEDERFGWKYSIKDLSEEDNLGEIDLEVSWRDGSKQGTIGVVSYTRMKE